jgi:hypothetical protein
MIRFLKNVRYDSELISDKPHLSSFHINAICYDINVDSYKSLHFLDIVYIVNTQLKKILSSPVYADNLMSVHGKEKIFEKDRIEKMAEIQALFNEVNSMLVDLRIESKLVA